MRPPILSVEQEAQVWKDWKLIITWDDWWHWMFHIYNNSIYVMSPIYPTKKAYQEALEKEMSYVDLSTNLLNDKRN